MKTLKEEVMELLMKRIGVVEDEEFKASTVEGACATYKISKGKLLCERTPAYRGGSFLLQREQHH